MSTVPTVISTLVIELDRYLSVFDMPGVRDVRNGIAHWSTSAPQPVAPATLPVCSHVDAALTDMRSQSLAEAIAAAMPLLKWATYDAYDRSDIGESFADGHAFASLIGDGAFHQADDFDLGLFIIKPNVYYPDHHHAAPELYAPLTGPHGWRFLPDTHFHWRDANQPVWNEPWAPHATLTGDVPFLSIFCWTRDVSMPAKIINSCAASQADRNSPP